MATFWFLVFWLSIAGIGYIYVGYPLLIWACGRFWGTELDREPWTGSISVVLVAHNAAQHLLEKLDSILASDCADQICEVLVGSDGSTDATVRTVNSYPDDRVQVVDFGEQRGKPACLNDLIPQCTSDIVVLTDARRPLHPEAISRMAAVFADVRVAAVSGELVHRGPNDESPAGSIGVYQRYERWIRRNESRFRSVPGVTGALYAIRRNVFRAVPTDAVLDDVVLPMQLVSRGYHCAFEPDAIAWDQLSESPEDESIRKRRTIAGCAQLLHLKPGWLSPHTNQIWWEFMSHRIARLASPLLLLCAAIANFALIGHGVYAELAAFQILLYLLAFLGWHYQRRGSRSRLCGLPLKFVMLNTTTLAALWDAAHGRFTPTWQRAT